MKVKNMIALLAPPIITKLFVRYFEDRDEVVERYSNLLLDFTLYRY